MSPFEPTGDQARWRTLYALVKGKPVDGVLTYDEMADALDLNPVKDRHIMQMAMRRAARESETNDLRALEAVTNVGYRVVEASEHMRLAKKQQKRANKALAAGHSKVVHVDLNGLDPEARKAFDVVASAFAMQMDFNRRMDVRQKRLEQAVAAVSERTGRSEAEVSAMQERLARLERLLDGGGDPPPVRAVS